MDDQGSRLGEFWRRHSQRFTALANKYRAGKGIQAPTEDILAEVAAKAFCHPQVELLLAQDSEEEVLKYVTGMIRNEVGTARRNEGRSTPPIVSAAKFNELDPAELRDEVRKRLGSPARVLEVSPRFIKSLPGLFHWDPCAHEFIAPVMGLLAISKIRELMEREFALYTLLWRIATPSSRWRMEESHFRLLAGLQEEVEIAMGVLAILRNDEGPDSGAWGHDPLGSLIDRLLVAPARAHVNAEHSTLLELRDGCDFTGTLEHGVNPVGRALAHAAELHTALQKVSTGERRALLERESHALGTAAKDAGIMYLVWCQYQPDIEAAVERFLGKDAVKDLEKATKKWIDAQSLRKESKP